MPVFVFGIDGGGTSCRAAVATVDGRIVGRGLAGAANILTDPDLSLVNIEQACRLACAEAGLDAAVIAESHALLGLAGGNVGEAVARVSAHLPFASARIESDALIALHGAIGSGDGAIAILGTGTAFLARRGQNLHPVGGWGFFVGDFGSGARLGQVALQESLLAHDGVRPGSALTESILTGFGNDPRQVVTFARTATPGDFGRFAPAVFEAADRGDAVGLRILEDAAGTIDEALDAVTGGLAMPVALLGGLARPFAPWLSTRHHLVEPKDDALTGAVALACEHENREREKVA